MEYQWTKQDGAYQESDVPARQNCRINIMTEEEFQEKFPVLLCRGFIGGKVSHNRFCKADRLNKTVAGDLFHSFEGIPVKGKDYIWILHEEGRTDIYRRCRQGKADPE